MELVAAAVLGVVQGLTEFLPISSSAHLILVPWFLGWNPEGLAFDVSLHVGTALAILAYFWKDWSTLVHEAIRGILDGRPLGNPDRRLAWYLAAATLPAVAAGLTMEKIIEEQLRSPMVTVATLVVFGLFLYYADRKGRRHKTVDALGWADAIWIGMSQALALIPGVSRSGITISTGLLRDLDRASAARFSFLLATPAVVGAAVLEGRRLVAAAGGPGGLPPEAVHWGAFAVGVIFATGSGFLCIRYFLRYLRRGSFFPFVLYRIALALLVLMFYIMYMA